MTRSLDTIRIAQLSDTHFLEPGRAPEGGFAYDTSAAFDAVLADLESQPPFDLVVVTGDIADHGEPAQYLAAADAFDQITAPVHVCPGNHDQDVAFHGSLDRPRIGTERVIEQGNWCFLFVDSNSGIMHLDASGRLVDPDDYGDRLHANGSLGAQERAWIQQMCATTDAEHVFIWIHHPPGVVVGMSRDDSYEADWRELIVQLPNVRGLGAGHTHVPAHYDFEGRTVYVCSAFKNNFDLDAETMLPPGYRSYAFHADGAVESQVHNVDDPQWPRSPLGRAVVSLMRGELSWDDFDAIVARKRVS